MNLANKHDVVIVPYGGGTNVTQALQLNPKEKRMIVSLDMSRMNRIKWVDKINMLASIEAGIIGQDLERELKNYGSSSDTSLIPLSSPLSVVGFLPEHLA